MHRFLFLTFFIISINQINIYSQVTTTKQGDVIITTVLNPGQSIDENGQYKYIVQFKEDCFVKSKDNVSFYLNRKSEFENDVNNILSSKGGLSIDRIDTKEFYYKSFFGASLKCTPEVVEEIKKLDYVQTVSLDRERNIDLSESIDLLNIPSVWEDYGVLGDSIKIGIFDTGIDWTHPDLGGGFGPGYKVVGGANFVNPYASPMDDHGHGTHVAGIAAANGTIKGIAPHALLYACKVHDENGVGYNSDILEALEYAIDPNNDNNTSDKIDIINMSFGGTPYDDDPLPYAVTNIINEGIICCIASGNEFNYFTIDSPGITEEAITVGNMTKDFEISSSSSKGPTFDYQIKPDIVAIGANVNSTFLNISYVTASGTSMSTPMVTGACALLKQLHPSWAPNQIKSALINTANKLGANIMAQGAGVMNLHKAVQVSTTVSPSLLNYGEIVETNSTWTTNKTLTLHNFSSQEKTYEIEILNENAGITITPETDDITIPAYSDIELTINLDLVLPEISHPNESSNSFEGDIVLKSSDDTLRVPWACVKASKAVLILEKPAVENLYVNIYIANKNYYYSNHFFQETNLTKKLISGFYNIYVYMTDYENILYGIIREEIYINGTDTINISYKDAVNEIQLRGKDENGEILKNSEYYEFKINVIWPDSSQLLNVTQQFINNINYIAFNQFNKNFEVIFSEAAIDSINNTVKMVNYKSIKDLHSDTILVEQAILKQKLIFSHFLFPKPTQFKVVFSNVAINPSTQYAFSFGGSVIINELKNNKTIVDFYTNSVINKRGFSFLSFYYDPLNFSNTSNITLAGYDEKIGFLDLYGHYKSIYLSPSNDTLNLGNNLVYIQSYIKNSVDRIHLYRINLSSYFNEIRKTDYELTRYTVYNKDNHPLLSDDILNYEDFIVDEPGVYSLAFVDSGFSVNGVQGKSETRSTFDLLKEDKNPPATGFVEVRNSLGKPTNKLKTYEKGTIYFGAYDVGIDGWYQLESDAVKVYLRTKDEITWTEITVDGYITDSLFGDFYRNIFYSTIDTMFTNKDSTYIEFKLVITDDSENESEITIEPAVTVGKMQAPFIYPIANVDTFYVKENKFLEIEKEEGILTNDEGEEPFNLYASLNRTSLHGTLELNMDGSFTYQPDTNYFGKDDFYYYAHNQKEELKSQLTKAVIIIEEGNAIEEIEKDQFSVFPNPFSNEITIHLNKETTSNVIIEIYDVQGRKLSQIEKPFSNQIKLTKSEMNITKDGLYLMSITSNNISDVKQINFISNKN